MSKDFTPKQVAQAIGVSEASVKRWCDRGLIATTRTAGGHRRIPLSSVVHYLRSQSKPALRPELLGLPPASGKGQKEMKRASKELADALEAGDEERVRRISLDLFLAGKTCAEIFDQGFAGAFLSIGEHWEHGDTVIYQERRACEIAMRLIHELRAALPPLDDDAPEALGATLSGDPYTLPTAMTEVVLREAGWNATSYGIGLPAETLRSAISDRRPRLVWLAVSAIESDKSFLEDYRKIYDEAVAVGAAIAVGGRALGEKLRRSMRYSTFCDALQHLVDFAKSIEPPSARASGGA